MTRRKKRLTGAKLIAFVKGHHRLGRALKRAHIRITSAVLTVRRWTLSQRVLRLARKYVGVKEYPAGSNLTLFGKWYGWNGVAWCAIFVSFILSHAGRAFRWASVPLLLAAAKAGQDGLSIISAAQVNSTIRAGHPVLVCFDWEHDGTADHVGIAVKYVAKDPSLGVPVIHTIEGNTGNDNWSNGGEVCEEIRPMSLVAGLVKVA